MATSKAEHDWLRRCTAGQQPGGTLGALMSCPDSIVQRAEQLDRRDPALHYLIYLAGRASTTEIEFGSTGMDLGTARPAPFL